MPLSALALVFLLAAGSAPVPAAAPAALESDLRIEYLANEGFLIETSGHKILVDALFDRGVPGYATLPPELRSDLMRAEGRFAAVDLVLATHYHRDHFDARTVAAHLRANPRALFVSTEQALAALGEVAPEIAESGRVRGLSPAAGRRVAIEHDGMELEVLHLHHGHGGNPPTQNLGFLLKVGDWKLLHVGDTESTAEDFAVNNLVSERIDVAFLPDWHLGYPDSRELVDRVIRPRRTVAMHLALPSAPASYFGERGGREGTLEAIRTGFPDAVILTEPGATAILVDERGEAPTDRPRAAVSGDGA